MRNGSEQYGIYLHGETRAELTGATVQRCELTGFLHGIRLRAASNNSLLENVVHANGSFPTRIGYGIDLALESKNNALQWNIVQRNADEGIHIGSGGHNNWLADNVVTDNYREDLYSLASNGGVFLGNTVGGPGTGNNSLYLKDSSFSYLERNTFLHKTARIVGDAHDNQFFNNTFSGAGLHFQYYRGVPNRAPTNNRVTGGSITGVQDCLRFTSSAGNVVTDTTLGNCGTQLRAESPAGPSENTVIGDEPAKVVLDAKSTLRVGWRLAVRVQDATGAPVSGAEVRVTDVTGASAFTLLTDEGGEIPTQIVTKYSRSGGRTMLKTPYTLTTVKAGYVTDVRVIPLAERLPLTISLRSQ